MGLEIGETMDFIKIIKNRQESESYEYYHYGQDYYVSRNTAIMNRDKKVYVEGIGVQVNPFGANHKLPSGFFPKIVDQKVMHLLGKGVIFAEEGQTESLNNYFDTSFDEFIIDAGVEASKKGEAWAYFYKENNQLYCTLIPVEQCVPIYDDYGYLSTMIRHYQDEQGYIIQVYDENGMTKYLRKDNGEMKKLLDVGHYTTFKQFNGQVIEEEERVFDRIPFVPLYNNKERISDLYRIKPLIDVYDIINSDFANNIDDMQDAFFTLKGFTGDTKHLGEFMKQLKQLKVVPVGDDGEVNAQQLTIPVEARKTFLDILRKDIYESSMAVDLSQISGGSITNVLIKAMFTDLELKTDKFENELRKFIFQLLDFINANDNQSFTDQMTFDRSKLMNEAENIEMLMKLQGLLSQQTLRELLPYDIDLVQELERIREESGEVSIE
jgi:SPP1 family phage portal protein